MTHQTLADSLKQHNISLPKIQINKLDQYAQLLWDWNEKINLTRHTDYEKFVARDVVDSLALSEFLRQGERVLDVGTGGGVPGIILAILRPDLHIELCDSTGKKTLAVSEMMQELRINIPIHHTKADALLLEKGRHFTTLTIRAVSRMVSLLRHFAPCWSSFDRMLLVKGPKWTEERGEARHYNLMTKIALRCLKTYHTQTAESVILQLCLKENFERLDNIIDRRIQGKEHKRNSGTHASRRGPLTGK
ncbi:MAG: 16S rRNA (guanine(527)-N(7))-methyltransferase RsmG [Planctomycetaceae bacterium]|nr:16S rRNA (guanine(527)-N(7))-methyltransferase RsmG [Planctomycetaceae bacterium]